MTPATDPDCAALFKGVLDSPRDRLAKLVLADWLDERGEPVMAHGFRWCAAYGRHPEFTINGRVQSRRPKWESSRDYTHGGKWAPWWLPDIVGQSVAPTYKVGGELFEPGERPRMVWGHFAALAASLEEIAAVVRLPRD